MAANPLDHVKDTHHWEFFENLGLAWKPPHGLTKYMVLEAVAAVLILLIFVPLALKAKSGKPLKGRFWNAFESLLTFIREQVAKPCIGHDADHYVPFLWTLFLFILFCNLLGMLPFMGSPTASITVTGMLAVCTFFFVHGSAVAKMGMTHYLKSYVPHVEVPFGMGYFLVPMIVVIEVFGNFIKFFVLAVRLFANMFAGHTVLATLLLFIVMAKDALQVIFWPVTLSSVFMVTALSLLELFVAFLQAYVFVFLASLFLGAALHPQH